MEKEKEARKMVNLVPDNLVYDDAMGACIVKLLEKDHDVLYGEQASYNAYIRKAQRNHYLNNIEQKAEYDCPLDEQGLSMPYYMMEISDEYSKILTDKQKQVLSYYRQGYTQVEIADKIGKTERTVRNILHKAVNTLHKYSEGVELFKEYTSIPCAFASARDQRVYRKYKEKHPVIKYDMEPKQVAPCDPYNPEPKKPVEYKKPDRMVLLEKPKPRQYDDALAETYAIARRRMYDNNRIGHTPLGITTTQEKPLTVNQVKPGTSYKQTDTTWTKWWHKKIWRTDLDKDIYLPVKSTRLLPMVVE